MKSQELLEIVNFYQAILDEAGIEPPDEYSVQQIFRAEPDFPRQQFSILFPSNLAYCGWMLQQMRDMVSAGDQYHVDKFVRRLCFIQGVLWVSGLLTVQEARDHIRPLVKK